MTGREIRHHLLVIVATGAGIVGMGMIFRGITDGNSHTLLQGIAPLVLGLWWAGGQLGRSMSASRGQQTERVVDVPRPPAPDG